MASQPVLNNDSSKRDSDSTVKNTPVLSSPVGGKEKEVTPSASVAVESRDVHDEKALDKLKKNVDEAKLSQPEPIISKEVAAAGVYSPKVEAEEVAKAGSTIELPVSEEEFQEGSHEKVRANKSWATMIYSGTKSIIGIAIWSGRIIKMAHKHAKKIVFRKSNQKSSQEGGSV